MFWYTLLAIVSLNVESWTDINIYTKLASVFCLSYSFITIVCMDFNS